MTCSRGPPGEMDESAGSVAAGQMGGGRGKDVVLRSARVSLSAIPQMLYFAGAFPAVPGRFEPPAL